MPWGVHTFTRGAVPTPWCSSDLGTILGRRVELHTPATLRSFSSLMEKQHPPIQAHRIEIHALYLRLPSMFKVIVGSMIIEESEYQPV